MKRFFTVLGFALLSLVCFAQSAEKIEALIAKDTISIGEACYLAGCADEKITDDASFEEAFRSFNDTKIFNGKTAQDVIRLDEFANLALQSLGIEKNLWHRVGKSNHYALRTLVGMNIVKKTARSSSSVSGKEALRIFAELIKEKGENNK